MAKNNIAGETL